VKVCRVVRAQRMAAARAVHDSATAAVSLHTHHVEVSSAKASFLLRVLPPAAGMARQCGLLALRLSRRRQRRPPSPAPKRGRCRGRWCRWGGRCCASDKVGVWRRTWRRAGIPSSWYRCATISELRSLLPRLLWQAEAEWQCVVRCACAV